MSVLTCFVEVIQLTVLYWRAFLFFWKAKGSKCYDNMNLFGDDKWAKVQVYSLVLVFQMWEKDHYRSVSFQEDMVSNLRNVAIPGTGIPLSVFCHNYYICLLLVLFGNPVVCFCGALNKCLKTEAQSIWKVIADDFASHYRKHLLHPDDWFSFWRLNCRLASAHSLLTKSPGFMYENKWDFLIDGHKIGVPVSPFLEVDDIVCKHKNVEGGMGIHFFKNALSGGDWIIQERLANAAWLNKLLPDNAPLSTMRIITSSSYSLSAETGTESRAARPSIPSATLGKLADVYVSPLTAVLRLGRANASTDHSSVLFDVDMSSGRIMKGLDNSHWYRLGLHNIASCPWLPSKDVHSKHPDFPNTQVTGEIIPDFQSAKDICIQYVQFI